MMADWQSLKSYRNLGSKTALQPLGIPHLEAGRLARHGGQSLVGLLGAGLMLFTVAGGTALPRAPAAFSADNPPAETLVLALPDGAYQWCTEPQEDSLDWRDGAGVCLAVMKTGRELAGYYGYPHTERFVCLQGQIRGDQLVGTGYVISWPGHPWQEIPQAPFLWDLEGRLRLSEGTLAAQAGEVSWIAFAQAQLEMPGLYRYETVRMNPPAQLCDWQPGAPADR